MTFFQGLVRVSAAAAWVYLVSACGSSDGADLFNASGATAGASSGGNSSGGTSNGGTSNAGTGGSPIGDPCDSSAECTDRHPFCDPTSKRCVECVIEGHCESGESCVDNGCVERERCESQDDCSGTPATPECELAGGFCVECLQAIHCEGAADCVANQCVPFTPCVSSLECEGDDVCDPVSKRCVECAGVEDCPDNHLCVENACEKVTECESDIACKDLGQLCDKLQGICVDCLAHTDCDELQYCSGGACKLDVCVPGLSHCDPFGIVRCDGVGSSWLPSTSCPSETTCAESGNEAECKPWVCMAAASYCDESNTAIECSADGLSIKSSQNCDDTSQNCYQAECRDLVCEPNQFYCDDGDVWLCDPSGLIPQTYDFCASNEYCDPADAFCKRHLCEPNRPACDDDTATTCNSLGSGYVAGGLNCAAQGKSCSGGACVDCGPGEGNRDLRFVEMFLGDGDYVIVENRGRCDAHLGDVRFMVMTSSASGDTISELLPARTLKPGERVGIADSSTHSVAGDIIPSRNIFFTDATSDYAAICDGTCSGSSVIDLVAHYGGVTMPAYPSGVTFSPSGLTGITSTTSESRSYHRVAMSGSNPTFLRSDWTSATKTRGPGGTGATGGTGGTGGSGGTGATSGSGGSGGTGQCPATQPVDGSSCLNLGAACAYGNVTCSCLFQWVCQ